jgi:hypothetical protein
MTVRIKSLLPMPFAVVAAIALGAPAVASASPPLPKEPGFTPRIIVPPPDTPAAAAPGPGHEISRCHRGLQWRLQHPGELPRLDRGRDQRPNPERIESVAGEGLPRPFPRGIRVGRLTNTSLCNPKHSCALTLG